MFESLKKLTFSSFLRQSRDTEPACPLMLLKGRHGLAIYYAKNLNTHHTHTHHLLCKEFKYTHTHRHTQAYLGDIAGLIPDRCNKLNNAIKQITWIFLVSQSI